MTTGTFWLTLPQYILLTVINALEVAVFVSGHLFSLFTAQAPTSREASG